MDIKAYIDYFTEIAHLPREDQFTYLEKVRDSINQGWPISFFTCLAILLRVGVLGSIYAALSLWLSFPMWVVIIALVIGLFVARIIEDEITTRMVRKKLKTMVSTHLQK
ncbi:hypothetical protein [Alteromonas facilis]|uniref:hypothetical protein n=1 Tax=Alteromonas facilis TaxID=2048004 RepID=UPI000C28C680|nr:hypothetical protein [Alteromonas facilis]